MRTCRDCGKRIYCKACQAERTRQYRAKNPEKIKAYKRKYDKTPKGRELKARERERNREKYRERNREYERQNKDRARIRWKRWYDANREHHDDYRREWLAAHPGKQTEYSRRYRHGNAHVRQAMEQRRPRNRDEDSADYADILVHDPCSYCGGEAGSIDHIDAIHHGGENHWSNYTAACRACNGGKRERSLLTYLLGA